MLDAIQEENTKKDYVYSTISGSKHMKKNATIQKKSEMAGSSLREMQLFPAGVSTQPEHTDRPDPRSAQRGRKTA